MCTTCATAPSIRVRHRNATSFTPGPNCRRHRFTLVECRRGGKISWARTMIELRSAMSLPISTNILELAELPF